MKAIALELDVTLSPEHQRSDTDIAHAAEIALKWNTFVPAEQIKVIVDHGWVTLQGKVEWDYQRRSVEKAIRPLAGVTGLTNQMTLRAKPQVANISYKIEEALKRQALRDAQGIKLTIDGTTVKLQGTVHSWQERTAAQGAAFGAFGVRAVINELHVS